MRYLEPKILLIPKAISPSLNYPDLSVEPFDEAKSWLVLEPIIFGESIPVALDHPGELDEWLDSLPLERGSPVFKKLAHPGFALVEP